MSATKLVKNEMKLSIEVDERISVAARPKVRVCPLRVLSVVR
jgi:hypothetical protein